MKKIYSLLLFILLLSNTSIIAQQNGCFIKKFTITSTYYNYTYTYTWQDAYNNTWASTDGSYGSNEFNSSYQPVKIVNTSSGSGLTTTIDYTYNSYGKIKTTVTSNYIGTTTVTYTWTNAKNNTWTSTDGSYGSNTYDSNGYLTYYSSTSGSYTSTATYTYNSSDQLTKVVSTGYSGTITTTYTWTGNDNTWSNTNGDYGAYNYDVYGNLTDYTYNTSSYSFAGLYEYDCTAVVGIEENQINENSILVFPNPAKDKIVISNLANEETSIEIYDFNGKVVKNINEIPNNNEQEINLSELNSGIYFIKVLQNNQIKTSKLILQ
ncbi:MAG: hypothetical protein A3K10_04725 [Bacteroidetes bacterium RIFCSPLOWO2_12_FULL_31_6]|nr:MAG: hypothetical protein A3K10_04725 [Bacteroidetes bacterium RIFCSPLOWO2_12_FULL_31_6]